MGEPWGMSGPQFLGLYSVLLVLTGVMTLVLRRYFRSGTERVAGYPLSAEELAYLTGGRPRMIETAVAALLERNQLRIDRSGKLQPVSGAHKRAETPLQTAILREIGRYGRGVAKLRQSLAADPAVTTVEHSLVERGLLTRSSFGRVLAAASPLLAVFAIGLARFANGLSLDRPVGWLVAFLVLTLILLLFALRPLKTKLTKSARRIVSSARKSARSGAAGDPGDPNARSYSPEVPMMVGAVSVVALSGLVAYPDEEVVEALGKQSSSFGSGSPGSACSSGSSCSSSSSSSCSSGGGSSCGGGGGGGGCGG